MTGSGRSHTGSTNDNGGSRSMLHTLTSTLFQLRGQTWAGIRPLLANKWF